MNCSSCREVDRALFQRKLGQPAKARRVLPDALRIEGFALHPRVSRQAKIILLFARQYPRPPCVRHAALEVGPCGDTLFDAPQERRVTLDHGEKDVPQLIAHLDVEQIIERVRNSSAVDKRGKATAKNVVALHYQVDEDERCKVGVRFCRRLDRVQLGEMEV
jgi:hypothetical protein